MSRLPAIWTSCCFAQSSFSHAIVGFQLWSEVCFHVLRTLLHSTRTTCQLMLSGWAAHSGLSPFSGMCCHSRKNSRQIQSSAGCFYHRPIHLLFILWQPIDKFLFQNHARFKGYSALNRVGRNYVILFFQVF